jgi:hypothetical protein
MKKHLVIKQQDLLSPEGDNVPNFKGGDEAVSALINLFIAIFEKESDVIAMDASSGSNSVVNVNFHWASGASTFFEVSEDDSITH